MAVRVRPDSRGPRRSPRLLRSAPVAVCLVVLYLGAAIPGRLGRPSGGAWASVLHGYLPSAAHVPSLLLGAVVLAVACGWAERRLGSGRFTLAVIGTQLVALAAGIGFVAWISPGRAAGEHLVVGGHSAAVSVIACGVAAAASARLRVMWRRRLRTALVAIVVVGALYAGTLSDALRLAAVLAGLFIGPVLLGRRPSRPAGPSTLHERRVLVAVLLLAAALGPVVAALAPGAVGPLAVLRYLGTDWAPADPASLAEVCAEPARVTVCAAAQLQHRAGLGAVFTAILPSILLAVLADGLRRGLRMAWWGAVIAQGALAALTLVYLAGIVLPSRLPRTGLMQGLGTYDFTDYAQAKALILPLLVPLAVFAVLVGQRRFFRLRTSSGTGTRLLRRIVLLGAGLSVIYLVLGWWGRAGFRPAPSPGDLFENLPERFLPLVYALHLGPEFVPVRVGTMILFEGLGIVFWTATAAWLLGAFLGHGTGESAADRGRAREVLRRGTGGTLSWMGTWSGNSYWFAPDGQSYVAYRVIAGVALTTANPVAAQRDLPEVVEGFVRHCAAHGWVPCLYSVTGEVAAVLPAASWSRLRIATETVLELGTLEFRGKRFQDVRTALNRAEKEAVRAVWTSYPQLSLGQREQLLEISEEWVAERGLPELGFTLGGMTELEDPEVRLLLAVDAAGLVHAVTSWMPVYDSGVVTGWTLDFMRRRQDGFRPVMEFLIGTAALTLQAQGYAFLSLSGAPLAALDDATGERGAQQRLLGWLAATLEPVYGFQSLLGFKKKFAPRFVPWFMVYPDASSLPAITAAITTAYLGDVGWGTGWTMARTLLARKP
ncbi:bifunctional lysylphosphatidylglycerol flippase/synthetase MprF [Arthrobacter sp.]|uniref:bifunctional lysylphosphatidylglycerol flippase/synthetase MprF n=1 Tax=Arthrobacter sp. TaxID=1667 RepID=UPI003A906390